MRELKTKLHELIDGSTDNILLENIYNALRYQVEKRKKDILDELSPNQLDQLNESIAEYRRGETKTHEEVLQMLKEWRTK